MSLDIDMYELEYSQFQWDVHILIEGTLEASIRYLGTEARTELGKIEEALKNPHFDDEHQPTVRHDNGARMGILRMVQRRRARRTFAKYLSPEVIEKVLRETGSESDCHMPGKFALPVT